MIDNYFRNTKTMEERPDNRKVDLQRLREVRFLNV